MVDPRDVDEVEEVEKDENALIPDTVTKYQTAADIANKALAKVIAATVEGAKIIDLCALGDQTILDGVKSVYAKKKDMSKGIAFPTCVSPKDAICHLSPITQDAETFAPLKTGDTVRIELGAHIDGYIAHAAHTVVVGANKESAPITGRKADVMQAAYIATEAALRLLKPGKTNYEVTEAIEKIAADFECTPVQGMLSHQLKRNVLDGDKRIILNPTEQQKKEIEKFEFAEGEVYSLDILISTGEGVPKPQETRCTVFKKVPLASYQLKTAAARTTFSTISKENGDMAFSIRQFQDQTKARLGLIECAKHGLVTPYDVFYEKEGSEVAHILLTVLLMPNGPLKITGVQWDQDLVKADKVLKNEEIKELLRQPVKTNKKKKKAAAADA
ncbi:Proliferation-associated protein 2G4 [Chytridiales sp. JEL 0842]|nr:Proliferation-associated protein 2G4 [Chytridiales sp. JEL 0842]